MKNILKNKWVILSLVLVVGIFIGKIISPSAVVEVADVAHEHDASEGQIWTCAMHPQIRMNEPGSCPICGMELIPANDNQQEESDPNEVSMTEQSMKLADIQTMVVQKSKPEKEIRLLGRVKPDEGKLYTQAIHIPGRIEQLYINFTGERIVKGQKLARLYSPELITAQKELFESIKSKETYPELYRASINKLKLWKLTDQQITKIENGGEVIEEIDILSDFTGVVLKRMVEVGDHVKEGADLLMVSDLSSVWLMFEAYETDLPWLHQGDKIEFTIQGTANKFYKGTLNYIDPFVDAQSRIAQVRVNTPNANGKLLPEMYATGIVKADLKGFENAIMVPKSAVLWTGKRAVVYVKVPNRKMTSFLYREVILGEDVGDNYIITNGLEVGETIAINGVFRIDASAQLSSKKSMMNPSGGKSSTGGMAGMDMGGDKKEMAPKDMSKMDMKKEVMIDASKIPADFKNQIGQVVEKYLLLKDKLVVDNSDIKSEGKEMITVLQNVDMSLILGDAHNVWMGALKIMKRDLTLLDKAVSIDEQRALFSSISDELKRTVEKLGVSMNNEKPVYIDFCPMANDNKGGFWLSTDKEIKNPYLGKKMPKCGEIKNTIN
tara:strand:+ start:34278 stop:36098 length:1821 start_codon:yes stop_codon:yes gene_type:complete